MERLIVKYLIEERGADEFNDALGEAVRGGHMNIVRYLRGVI